MILKAHVGRRWWQGIECLQGGEGGQVGEASWIDLLSPRTSLCQATVPQGRAGGHISMALQCCRELRTACEGNNWSSMRNTSLTLGSLQCPARARQDTSWRTLCGLQFHGLDEAHLAALACLNDDDILAAIPIRHAVLQEEAQVVGILRVCVAEDVHHQSVHGALGCVEGGIKRQGCSQGTTISGAQHQLRWVQTDSACRIVAAGCSPSRLTCCLGWCHVQWQDCN